MRIMRVFINEYYTISDELKYELIVEYNKSRSNEWCYNKTLLLLTY